MYISQIPNIEKNVLKDNMTVKEFADYTQVNVHTEKQEGDIKFNVALVIRTVNTILVNPDDTCIKYIPVECLRVNENPNSFMNNYPNMISLVAREVLETYNVPRHQVNPTTTYPNTRGIILTDDALTVVVELFVEPNIFTENYKTFESLDLVKKDFKIEDNLDTIIIHSLKYSM